jgi:hypothetical protein
MPVLCAVHSHPSHVSHVNCCPQGCEEQEGRACHEKPDPETHPSEAYFASAHFLYPNDPKVPLRFCDFHVSEVTERVLLANHLYCWRGPVFD